MIKIIGLGGAGCVVVNTLIEKDINDAYFIAINTNFEDLQKSRAALRLQIGRKITHGQGTGGNPENGRVAALEDRRNIEGLVHDSSIVLLIAGMGGGTGTGSAPIILEACKDACITTVSIVTQPFEFEGPKRNRQAEEGIRELQNIADKLIVIPDDSLVDKGKDTIMDCFKKSDEAFIKVVQKELLKTDRSNIPLLH